VQAFHVRRITKLLETVNDKLPCKSITIIKQFLHPGLIITYHIKVIKQLLNKVACIVLEHCKYAGPSRATAGPGKPLSWGPIATSFRTRRDWKRREGGNVGGVSPHHPTRGLESVVSSPSGFWDRAPAENEFYAYLRSERSHLEHSFQYFWALAGPQTSRGLGKLSRLSPLNGPVSTHTEIKLQTAGSIYQQNWSKCMKHNVCW